jgi:hypothetical protein
MQYRPQRFYGMDRGLAGKALSHAEIAQRIVSAKKPLNDVTQSPPGLARFDALRISA